MILVTRGTPMTQETPMWFPSLSSFSRALAHWPISAHTMGSARQHSSAATLRSTHLHRRTSSGCLANAPIIRNSWWSRCSQPEQLIYVYIDIDIDISIYVYVYIYICIYVYVYIYIYVYIYYVIRCTCIYTLWIQKSCHQEPSQE